MALDFVQVVAPKVDMVELWNATDRASDPFDWSRDLGGVVQSLAAGFTVVEGFTGTGTPKIELTIQCSFDKEHWITGIIMATDVEPAVGLEQMRVFTNAAGAARKPLRWMRIAITNDFLTTAITAGTLTWGFA